MSITKAEPKRVMKFFEELCAMPHGSGNTKQISDYCVEFAKARGYDYVQDELNNVVIFCPGSEGCEDCEPVIIQGHMDMVCDSVPEKDIDMSKEGVTPYIDGEFIKADGTTLGADDGIALAYAFAVLDDKELVHPPIEAVFTVDEETGLQGASGMDVSVLKGRKMLNIDSEVEGVLTVSCAGGASVMCSFPYERDNVSGTEYEIVIDGLVGGHSGMEINSDRANAIVLLGRVLYGLGDGIRIAEVAGGNKGNAIAKYARAKVVADRDISAEVSAFDAMFKKEFAVTDSGVKVSCKETGKGEYSAFTADASKRTASFLNLAPFGVYAMSADMPGLVQTSLNFGILSMTESEIKALYNVRSSVGSQKRWLMSKLRALTEMVGGKIDIQGEYSEWEYRRESPLRDLMVEVFVEQYGMEPTIEAIHAGVECGIFASKLDGLDCVSFGPDLLEIHTVRERMSIASVQRVWAYLCSVLERLTK